jgi:SAM-dependent methyltransferase
VSFTPDLVNDGDLASAGGGGCGVGASDAMTYWDRVAESTRWGRYVTQIEQQVILRAEAYATAPRQAVDFGCGSGRWSKLLNQRGWEMTCLDVNPHALGICQRNVPSAKCILACSTDKGFPVASNSASLALCIEVVPLIEAEWFPTEAHRVLADRGILVGVYINGQSLRGMASRLKNRFVDGQDNYNFYQSCYSDWKRRMVATGFEMLHEESCCWGPFTRDSNSPFVPAFTKMERALHLHRVVAFSPWVIFIVQKRPTESVA